MELLVATTIIAVVLGMLVMIMYQLLSIPRWGNAQLTVDGDMRNAGLWLMRDGNESQVFTATVPCDTFTFDTGRGRTYAYTRSGSTLSRQDSGTGQTIGVARHVTNLTCAASGDSAAVTLSVADGTVSASATFTVTMRVNQ